ncbi:PIG-L family deacetylase [Cryobacterium zhongshanensis]|uniref:PIG-L family deacetylase n=1 Tax=Cryobacterium zhongshanensis TaxID=2928153 RepID=A0AA41R010_9MICO|nr:PIG-L family deacetylase [Cryobacterium zhongshanensis]MCI4659884.1 PIG-L family deacetylase [Cryobacterium zhongshanensis]
MSAKPTLGSSSMVMSGSAERVVFVHDGPGDEAWFTGGTIARLRGDDAEVVVLFGARAPGDDGDSTAGASSEVRAALSALGVSDWRFLPVAADPAAAVVAVLDEVRATAIVIGARSELLQAAAADAARVSRVPVFVSRGVTEAIGQRIVAIDVSDHLEQKLAALSAYSDRWTVDGRVVSAIRPGAPAGTVTGTETYLRDTPPPAAPADRSAASAAPAPQPAADPADAPQQVSPAPAGPVATGALRALASLVAFAAGVVFGVLGTVAHQATVSVGSVTLPAGLVLATLAASALLIGLRLVLDDRVVVLACTIGLVGSIFLLSLKSTGGSVLVPAGLAGTLWTALPTLVASLVLAWPRLPQRSTRPGRGA